MGMAVAWQSHGSRMDGVVAPIVHGNMDVAGHGPCPDRSMPYLDLTETTPWLEGCRGLFAFWGRGWYIVHGQNRMQWEVGIGAR